MFLRSLIKSRNIGLSIIHIIINRAFKKNLLVEEDLLGIRNIELRRDIKRDLFCIILHNIECYQFRYIEQIILCKKKFLYSWRYRTINKLYACISLFESPTTILIITYPTWTMDEYTRIRFMYF